MMNLPWILCVIADAVTALFTSLWRAYCHPRWTTNQLAKAMQAGDWSAFATYYTVMLAPWAFVACWLLR